MPTYARDIKLDGDGDLSVSGGDLEMVSDADGILQSINTRLQFFQGEWFLDEDAGIPYFQSVLIKNPDPNVLSAIFRETILETPGVSALNDLTLDFDRSARRLSVSFRVETDLGQLADTVEVS